MEFGRAVAKTEAIGFRVDLPCVGDTSVGQRRDWAGQGVLAARPSPRGSRASPKSWRKTRSTSSPHGRRSSTGAGAGGLDSRALVSSKVWGASQFTGAGLWIGVVAFPLGRGGWCGPLCGEGVAGCGEVHTCGCVTAPRGRPGRASSLGVGRGGLILCGGSFDAFAGWVGNLVAHV